MILDYAKDIKNILEKMNGMPCEVGALVDSGKLDCYSMVGTYLSAFDLSLIPHTADDISLYLDDKEAAMDKGCRNILMHCDSIHPTNRFFGDIIRAKFKKEHKTKDDDASFFGIHCGNAHILVADIDSFGKIMPLNLKYLDILVAYRIRKWVV